MAVAAPHRARARAGALMLAPAALLLLVFVVVPLLLVVGLAFTDYFYNPLNGRPWRFVGVDNFVRLLTPGDIQGQRFLAALGHNMLFTAVVVPLQTGLALALALLVDKPLPGRSLFRSALFLPLAVPLAVSGLLWKPLLDENGAFTALVTTLSFGHQPQWEQPGWGRLAIVVVSLWSSTAFQMVVLLAALQSVPAELHEAAMIDGAGPWRRLTAVTLPAIRNELYFVVTVTGILAFRLFDTVWIVPRDPGGPLGSTTTVLTYVVENYKRVGLVSAASVLFLAVVLLLTLVQRRFEPKE